MLSKPQRNPREGVEVKAGISSQVFVVFCTDLYSSKAANGERGSERVNVYENASAKSVSFSL